MQGTQRGRRPRQRHINGRDFLAAVGIVGVLVAADAGVNLMTQAQDRSAARGHVISCDDPLVATFDRGAVAFSDQGRAYQLVFGPGNWSAVCRGSAMTVDTSDSAITHWQGCNDIGGLTGSNVVTVTSPRRNHYRVAVNGGEDMVCLLGE